MLMLMLMLIFNLTKVGCRLVAWGFQGFVPTASCADCVLQLLQAEADGSCSHRHGSLWHGREDQLLQL